MERVTHVLPASGSGGHRADRSSGAEILRARSVARNLGAPGRSYGGGRTRGHRPESRLLDRRAQQDQPRKVAGDLWTLIVISAFLAGALANISANSVNPGSIADPLSIGVPEELWILMGISLPR